MDHSKAITRLLAFHKVEVRRFEIALRVILEIERRIKIDIHPYRLAAA